MFDFDDLEDQEETLGDKAKVSGDKQFANGDAKASPPTPTEQFCPPPRLPAAPEKSAPCQPQAAPQRTSIENNVDHSSNASPSAADVEFQRRVAECWERWPTAEITVPFEAKSWTEQELETFFESNGFLKPKKPNKVFSEPSIDQSSNGQMTLQKATLLLEQLHKAVSSSEVQKRLRQLSKMYPGRKEKGHRDVAEYFVEFEVLFLSVYAPVLERFNFEANWKGLQDMTVAFRPFSGHRQVKTLGEEINVCLGLPRDAKFRPTQQTDQAIIETPDGTGVATEPYGVPSMAVDEDGDEAHEFWMEPPDGGDKLQRMSSVLEASADRWKVVHSPSVTIRSRPDTKASPLGSRKVGEEVLGMACDGWIKLHSSELRRLKWKEAWILIDGAFLGLGKLMEEVHDKKQKEEDSGWKWPWC